MVKKSTKPHPLANETNWQQFWKGFWNGEKPKQNSDNIVTGHYNANTKRAITQRINNIIDDSKSIKIGKTGNSDLRSDFNDYRAIYKEMHLIYKSSSEEYISTAEEDYIKKFSKSHASKIDNKTDKRVGKMYSYDGYYYMYVVSR